MTSTIAPQADSPQRMAAARGVGWVPTLVVVALSCYLAPRVLTGADTMWMVALGDRIASAGTVPVGVPFASAETTGWPNVPVLGELLLYVIHSATPAGLALALLGLAATTLLMLAHDAAKAGAHTTAVALATALVGVGMLPTFGVVRAQMLSLIPYALLILLLRAESGSPSKRIWLVVPLIAVWGNLHGGVLVGVALIGCYLAFSRLRVTPLTALLVGLATLAALWANPALLRTGHYYLGVLSNEAARRGTELWARPDLESAFDLLMVLAALALGTAAVLRGRLRLWEICAVFGMAGATAMSARHGMWLLLFLLGPGALGITRLVQRNQPATAPSHERLSGDPVLATPHRGPGLWLRALTLSLAVVAGITVFSRSAALRGPVEAVESIRTLAGERVVLAPEPLAEDLAAAGVTIWASNPIDAFRPADQAAYLDMWLGHDGGRRAIAASEVVVAEPGSPAFTLADSAGCTEVGRAAGFAILDCHR